VPNSMWCFSLSQASAWPAVRNSPTLSFSVSSALASAVILTFLHEPSPRFRSASIPPFRKSLIQSLILFRWRPTKRATAAISSSPSSKSLMARSRSFFHPVFSARCLLPIPGASLLKSSLPRFLAMRNSYREMYFRLGYSAKWYYISDRIADRNADPARSRKPSASSTALLT
jgi:hypothetical protein